MVHLIVTKYLQIILLKNIINNIVIRIMGRNICFTGTILENNSYLFYYTTAILIYCLCMYMVTKYEI